MRFRQKFPIAQIVTAGIWIVLSGLWLHKPHAIAGIRSAYALTGFAWLFVLSMALACYFFIWWDIADDGITERRLWRTKFIPWDEVYRIGIWRPLNKTIGNTLEIEYARTGPMSDRGSLILLPTKRQSFLNAFRTHAPRAVIEV